MKLSISNIGWTEKDDEKVYEKMKEYGFSGLEIAPTRIFPDDPYDKVSEAGQWAEKLHIENGFTVASMQSIWYGRNERLFGEEKERNSLLAYTVKAIEFAEAVSCPNLVFGCPRNRAVPEGAEAGSSIEFFRKLGEAAYAHGTAIALEANPPVYNTNFLNTTEETLEFIERIGSPGILLNLDVGAMIENGEDITVLNGKEKLINHVHISESGLKPLKERKLHAELKERLTDTGYDGFVSIEVSRCDDVDEIYKCMDYVSGLFCK